MIDTLIKKIKETENPTVVGLDPRLAFVPQFIKDEMLDTYGNTPEAVAKAYLKFNQGIIDEVADLVPAVKPQVAMYEQLGAVGMQAYIDTISYAKEKGLVIVGDIKRSDIASTAEHYSDGHIGRVVVEGESYEIYKEDFITLNPYLGYDSIEPYMSNCKTYDKGLFVLVKTSNPNSGETQDIKVENGMYYYEYIGSLVKQWGEKAMGEIGYSRIGAVVGATHKEQGIALRKLMPKTFFLVPGYGAQGATAEDLKGCFNDDGLGALVNSSRGIIAAYQKEQYKGFGDADYAKASRQAVLDMKADLNRVR